MSNAYEELVEALSEGERVEAVVFGDYGWSGFKQPPSEIPEELRGKPLTLEEAKPYMRDWSFCGGHGSPDCWMVYIWTNTNIYFVQEYDGATSLVSIPRNPCECIPDSVGG